LECSEGPEWCEGSESSEGSESREGSDWCEPPNWEYITGQKPLNTSGGLDPDLVEYLEDRREVSYDEDGRVVVPLAP